MIDNKLEGLMEPEENINDSKDDSTKEEKVDATLANGDTEKQKLIELENENALLKSELIDQKNKYHRAYADLDNQRKKYEEEYKKLSKFSTQAVFEKLFPILDSFQYAFNVKDLSPEMMLFMNGFVIIRDQFLKVLQTEGITVIPSDAGVPFDANLHHAVDVAECEPGKENLIVECYQSGFMLADRVIRPSMVKVSVKKALDKS
jgi:molecular chaperone GrpE